MLAMAMCRPGFTCTALGEVGNVLLIMLVGRFPCEKLSVGIARHLSPGKAAQRQQQLISDSLLLKAALDMAPKTVYV
jgi:hypothetical protein